MAAFGKTEEKPALQLFSDGTHKLELTCGNTLTHHHIAVERVGLSLEEV